MVAPAASVTTISAAASALRASSATDLDTKDLLLRAREAEGAERTALLHEVISRHLGLADALANRYWHRGQDRDDLTQVARAGLVEAAQRFNPQLGDFVAFAVPTITGVIKRYFRDHTWTVRPPRQTQELVINVRQNWASVAQEIRSEPTSAQLAKRAGVSTDSVREAQVAGDGYRPASLTAGEYVLPSLRAAEDFERCEARTLIRATLRKLDPEERQLVQMRYFERLSQQEIASRLGTNQMSVSRQLTRLLRKLRDLVGSLEAA